VLERSERLRGVGKDIAASAPEGCSILTLLAVGCTHARIVTVKQAVDEILAEPRSALAHC
jgi:hypothetical protein